MVFVAKKFFSDKDDLLPKSHQSTVLCKFSLTNKLVYWAYLQNIGNKSPYTPVSGHSPPNKAALESLYPAEMRWSPLPSGPQPL